MKKINQYIDKTFNSFFVIGMLIPAGIKYISESIFKNMEFFASIDISKNQFILGIFLIINLLVYFFMMEKFGNEDYTSGIKKGYVVGVTIITLTLIFIIIF